jgi:hypothetical protein
MNKRKIFLIYIYILDIQSMSTRPNDYFDLPDEARADAQYVVEKVLAKRRSRKGKWEYLLKWAGCKFSCLDYSSCYFFTRLKTKNV